MPVKYTKEKLEQVVVKSISIQDVARIIVGKPVGRNHHQHIKKMIAKFNISQIIF